MNKEEYLDRWMKQIVKKKSVIANILKLGISEYKDLSVDQIIKDYIIGYYSNDGSSIIGSDTEINLGTRQIRYDVHLEIRLPNNRIGHVEIEIQNKPNLYSNICRAHIYVSANAILQLETVISDQQYEKLEKIYSIWLFVTPPKYLENNIHRNQGRHEVLFGDAKLNDMDFDYFEETFIFLGKEATYQIDELDFLNAMFHRDMDQKVRKEILRKNHVNDLLEKEVDKMINFGREVFEEGREEGREEGAEKKMMDVIMKFLQKNISFKDTVEFLDLNDEEVNHYAQLLIQKGIIV